MKDYILDTNVLLDDPDCIDKFKEHRVWVTVGVIQELDKFKKENDIRGRNARRASRNIEDAITDESSNVDILVHPQDKKTGKLNPVINTDLEIVELASHLSKKRDRKHIVVVVSNDVNLRLRCHAVHINTEEYRSNRVDVDTIPPGYQITSIDNAEIIEEIRSNGRIPVSQLGFIQNPHPWQYINLNYELTKVQFPVYIDEQLNVRPVERNIFNQSKLTTKNIEQVCVLHALYNPKIHLVAISGRAGCGKTLLSVDAGYSQTMSDRYDRLLISRPVVPMGRDLGYLPGTVEEKLDPWMQPIYDALDVIGKSNNNKGKSNKTSKSMIMDAGSRMKVEPLTYIRGRSIHRQFMIVDEVQNLSSDEMKTILTRAGQDTKIVLTGDVEQIDNPYVDRYNNGLSCVMRNFAKSEISAHIIMRSGIRSRLACEASELM